MTDENETEAKSVAEVPPTPEELAAHIRELILAGRQSRRNRKLSVRKGDLKALAEWERRLTNNYGVTRGS